MQHDHKNQRETMFVVLFRLSKEQMGNVYIWVLKNHSIFKTF